MIERCSAILSNNQAFDTVEKYTQRLLLNSKPRSYFRQFYNSEQDR